MESTKADDHFHTKAIWPIAFLTILALNVNFTLSKNSENFMSVLNTFKNYHFFNLILFLCWLFFIKKQFVLIIPILSDLKESIFVFQQCCFLYL